MSCLFVAPALFSLSLSLSFVPSFSFSFNSPASLLENLLNIGGTSTRYIDLPCSSSVLSVNALETALVPSTKGSPKRVWSQMLVYPENHFSSTHVHEPLSKIHFPASSTSRDTTVYQVRGGRPLQFTGNPICVCEARNLLTVLMLAT